MRRALSSRCRAIDRLSVARNWRRCRRRSPRFGRSSSALKPASSALASAWSKRWARARAREGYTRLCAFAHDPAFFVHRGFSIVPHTWVPEKIAHDCVSVPAVPQLRPVRHRAGPRRRRRRTIGEPAPNGWGTNVRLPMSDVHARSSGGVTAPAGFRASGLHCGIKANGKPDLSLIVSDTLAAAAGVFTTNLAKAAPVLSLPGSSGRQQRTRAGHRHQQRLRQRVHRSAGHGGRARDGAADVDGARLPRTSRAGRIDRRDRRQSEDGQAARGNSAGGIGAGRRRRRRRRARHHDDGSFSEGMRGRSDDRVRRVPRRRNGEGLGHDRAADGDDARLPDDGCGMSIRLLLSTGAERSDTLHLQRDHRRRRAVDQRLRVRAGQRRERRPDQREPLPRARRRLPRRRSRARAGHRSRRRRRDQTGRGHGQRRGNRCGCLDGRARDRQFSARQDRGPRR